MFFMNQFENSIFEDRIQNLNKTEVNEFPFES